ncbi:MAG: hypothetical protein ACTSUE_08975 [Promethearchaeota archaeon]
MSQKMEEYNREVEELKRERKELTEEINQGFKKRQKLKNQDRKVIMDDHYARLQALDEEYRTPNDKETQRKINKIRKKLTKLEHDNKAWVDDEKYAVVFREFFEMVKQKNTTDQSAIVNLSCGYDHDTDCYEFTPSFWNGTKWERILNRRKPLTVDLGHYILAVAKHFRARQYPDEYPDYVFPMTRMEKWPDHIKCVRINYN